MSDKKQPAFDLAFIEHLPTAACAVDANGKVTLWNSEMVALTGHAADAMLGKKAWNGLWPQRGATPIDEALSTGDVVEAELSIAHKGTNAQSEVLCKAKPIFESDKDDPVGAVATFEPATASSG